MPLIHPDFSEVKSDSPVPAGTYSARVKECELKESKAGTAYLYWKIELFGSPEINNRIVFTATPIRGPGAFRLQQFYRATMHQEINSKIGFDTDSLLGKELSVTLSERKDSEGNVMPFPDVKSVSRL